MREQKSKVVRRQRRHRRVRKRVIGSAERPRLTVFRSLKHFYAQVIDDFDGKTLAWASTKNGAGAEASKGKSGADAAEALGTVLAEAAKAAGISKVAFDRGPYKFHGRVKAFAESARKGGLAF
jgi:large subunit ribosomal protein L18